MRALILAVLLGLTAALPARAQTVTLNVCNTGAVDIDVFTELETGPIGSSTIKPSACAAVATADEDGMEAYLGLAFADSRGQWGPPKRFDNLPNMGVRPIPIAAGVAAALKGVVIPPQPRIVSAADKEATVRHAGVFSVLPMQLLFRPAFPGCRSVPTGRSTSSFIGGREDVTIEHERICEDIAYTLMVEPHTDSHEASLGSLPVGGGFKNRNQLRSGEIEETAQVDWAQVAADKKQRDTLTSLSWNDLVSDFKKSLQTVRDPDALTGSRYAYRMPNLIKMRGTVAAVEVKEQTVDERTKVTVAEINFRESPVAAGASRPEFNVCTTRLDALRDAFGADFRTSMIGKTIEVEGKPRGLCSGQIGKIEFVLARQVRPVGWAPSSTGTSVSSTPRQTTVPNAGGATSGASAPLAGSVQSVAGFQPSWIGQKIKVIGTVSRFVVRDIKGEKWAYLYLKERPDSAIAACTQDDRWLLGVLGVDNYESLVGTTIEFSGDIVKGTCTEQGAGLWIWERHQARIIGGPAR
jgi:hypothetical protein